MAKKESLEQRAAREGGQNEVRGSDDAYRIQRTQQRKEQRNPRADKRTSKR